MIKKLFILLTLCFPSICFADGTITAVIGNGVGSYNSEINRGYYSSSSYGTIIYPGVSINQGNDFFAKYPGLDSLPGSNRTVTSATWDLYYNYENSGAGHTYTLQFYEAVGSYTTGTPFYTESGWHNATTYTLYHFPITNSIVQGWIDTPANNQGMSIHNGGVGSDYVLSFGSMLNSVLSRRPTLTINYSYTGNISPPVPQLTEMSNGWYIKPGTLTVRWDYSPDIIMDTSAATAEVEYQVSGSNNWQVLATGIHCDDKSWVWNTSGLSSGTSYDFRIRSRSAEGVASAYSTVTGLQTTTHPLDVVEINNLTKIHPTDVLTIPGTEPAHTWFAGRGESQEMQLVLVPHQDLANVHISNSTFSDGLGHSLPTLAVTTYIEQFVNCATPSNGTGIPGYWPDALLPVVDPIWGETRNIANIASMPDFKNVPFVVDAVVPIDQVPGTYHGSVTISADGLSDTVIPLVFRVRNYTLPATASLKTTMPLSVADIDLLHITTVGTKDSSQRTELQLWSMYQTWLLKNYRISADTGSSKGIRANYVTSTGITSVATYTQSPYLNLPAGDPKVVAKPTMQNWYWNPVSIDGTPGPSNGATAAQQRVAFQVMYEYIVAQGWNVAPPFYYLADEPNPSAYQTILTNAQNSKFGAPGILTLITAGPRRVVGANGLKIDPDLLPYIDIFVHAIGGCEDTSDASGGGIAAYDALQTAGKQFWTYVSNTSTSYAGAPGWHIDTANGEYVRVTPWIAWFYNIKGLLYWETQVQWTQADPYNTPYQAQYGVNGDGILIYPGSTGIIGGSHGTPIPSIRLMELRNGLQDFEYFKLLKEKGSISFLTAQIARIIPVARSSNTAVRNWVKDADLMQDVRNKMADELERKQIYKVGGAVVK